MRFISSLDDVLGKYFENMSSSWRPLMSALTFLGEPAVVLTVIAAGYISAYRREQDNVKKAFIYGVLAFGINSLIKQLLHRRRPHDLITKTLGVRTYSFPSGHAFGTVIFYGLFAYLDYRYLSSPLNIILALIITILIIGIGLSRVYLKFHYPSDVIAGWVLGLVSLLIIVELCF